MLVDDSTSAHARTEKPSLGLAIAKHFITGVNPNTNNLDGLQAVGSKMDGLGTNILANVHIKIPLLGACVKIS